MEIGQFEVWLAQFERRDTIWTIEGSKRPQSYKHPQQGTRLWWPKVSSAIVQFCFVVVFSLKYISCLRKFAMFGKLFSTLVSGTKLSCTDDKRSKLSSWVLWKLRKYSHVGPTAVSVWELRVTFRFYFKFEQILFAEHLHIFY